MSHVTAQREAGQQVLRDGARVLEVPQLRDENQALPSGEDLVAGSELSGEADRLPYVGTLPGDVEAVDGDVPPSALSSVERILTTVVLPAPLEPSRAKMLPGATAKSTPRGCSDLDGADAAATHTGAA